jgi:hypothetical protein
VLLLEPEPELALDDALEDALDEALEDEALDDALEDDALDEEALDDALDEEALEVVPAPKQAPIDGESLGASHEGFVLSVALTQTPTPSPPPAVVSHLPVPQSESAQQ